MRRILIVLSLFLAVQGFSISILSTNKNITTCGTAEAIHSTTFMAQAGTIKAKDANTGLIYIGNSSIDNTGFSLKNDQAVAIGDLTISGSDKPIDLKDLYIDCSVNGEGIEILGIHH